MNMYDMLLARQLGAGGGGGTTNYNALENKPEINGVLLQGNKSTSDLGFGTAAEKDYTDTVTDSGTDLPTSNAVYDFVQPQIDTLRLMMDATVYGFRIDKQDSNPETRVEYLYDAVGMTPARMNFQTGQFDYGSWANAWFITGNKPCALKYDGTIDYYLNPDDYTKKADGTASDVSDSSYAGNFMASMPAVWIKRWEDERYLYCAFSDKQINSSFKAYAHDAGDGFINDFIYLPMFKGTVIDTYLRSIADQYPTVGNSATTDRTAAVKCGSGWDMWAFSAHTLITDLLTLISKSTNSQTAFGYGKARDSSETTHEGAIKTGVNDLNTGQFYGVNNETSHVKVFHIEDYWGNRFERSVGLHIVDNKYMYKLTPPYTSSGSAQTYTLTNIDAPDVGYLTNCYVGEYGMLPKTVGGSTSTYFCDYFNVNASGTRTAIFGGFYETLGNCGSYFLSLATASGSTSTTLGASPCYNPPHSS